MMMIITTVVISTDSIARIAVLVILAIVIAILMHGVGAITGIAGTILMDLVVVMVGMASISTLAPTHGIAG